MSERKSQPLLHFFQSSSGFCRFAAVAGALLPALLSVACREPPEPFIRGKERYAQCTPCHGQNGDGNITLEAPPIAGMSQWYLEAQLHKFRIGARGTHPDDAGGMRMRPMALTLPTDDDVKAVAQYVSQMPVVQHGPSGILGSVERGRGLFVTCTACHGPDAAGNVALSAPPIAGHDDWYIFNQLQKFKTGIRGAHPKDATGASMRAIALTLPDEQAMRDVAAYIATLPKVNSSKMGGG